MRESGECKNHLSVPPSKKLRICIKRTEGAYSKQECSQNPEPPVLLQPSFQRVHHVSRFNPTVPYPQANRILSQSIMLIAKELACPWGNCGKILRGHARDAGHILSVTASCRGGGSKGGFALRNMGCARSLL